VRRYARILAVIAFLVTLASIVLGFQNIKIGNFERGSGAVLGLKLGLDLQGGSHLVYRAALKDPETEEPLLPSQDQMEALKKTIERRVSQGGLGEPIIQILGDDRLLIQLPGLRDPGRAKSLIGETARLEFKQRTLNVTRDLVGLTSEDVVSVAVLPLEEALAGQSTTTPTSLSKATSTEPTPVGLATSTEAIAATDQGTTSNPALVIEFTDEAATEFAKVLDRLRESLNPVKGTGIIYPNFLIVSTVGGTAPAPLRVSYYPLVIAPGGQLLPLVGEPSIQRLDGGTRFVIDLAFLLTDAADAEERFGGDPELRLEELLGMVDEDIGLTGEDLARAYPGQHQGTGQPIVNIEFNTEGTRTFGEVTTRIAGTSDLLAIFLDDTELISPGVDTPITSGAAFIRGADFTFERVRNIALLLESGRLPIPIDLIHERDVDAILGADSLAKSVVAGLVGLALVLVFMSLYYRVAGVVAAASLVIYAAFVLAIFKMVPVTLTLSGVAAAILSVGMAVDANILIFERMKEELRAGRTLLSSINIGFNRAWPAIRDGNVSTLITCAILFWFADTLGATIVQGFAITLAIGVAISMFSAITVSRTFLRVLAATRLNRRPGLFAPAGSGDLPQRQPGAEDAQRS
jgi:protein-export membrane protein SecD